MQVLLSRARPRQRRGAGVLLVLVVGLLTQCGAPGRRADAPPPAAPPQILWQRTLEDALILARLEHKPLLIAVNMDGESASERIGKERYRDPRFVAATREFVCVVASVFRHAARDYDDQGRRIPCPRLGEVTCGEHMALEPVLWDKFLADGERVAPRHALILPDGRKAWDEALLFDMRDLNPMVEQAAAQAVKLRHELTAQGVLVPQSGAADDGAWPALAARRDQRGRARLEAALRTADAAALRAALAAHGDPGALPALRVACGRLAADDRGLAEAIAATARALDLTAPLAAALRELLGDAAPGAALDLLDLLVRVDGGSAATRSLVLALDAAGHGGAAAAQALAQAFGGVAPGGARTGPDLVQLLARADAVTTALHGQVVPTRNAADQMPDTETLDRTLAELDPQLRAHADDPELLARYAKATLDLARRHLETRQKDVPLLLEDAARRFDRALAARPEQVGWWIERARTAYFQERFAEQLRCGERAFALRTGGGLPGPAAALEDADAMEALRWVGDAHARLLGERAGKDPAVERAGMHQGLLALGLVAASPGADAKDWLSFASFLAAIGLRRGAVVAAVAGATRQPASAELRQLLNDTLWSGGRIDAAGAFADTVSQGQPTSAEALWFAGYAWNLVAEQARRAEAADAALSAYDTAQQRFECALALRPDFADSVRQNLAIGWLGRGMAHLLADRRADAAAALVRAIAGSPAVAAVRDGLDREAIDLLDQALEWRESGPSPVDALALLTQLEAADPGNPAWGVAVADTGLREALRADGRNPDRVERDTVDAAGKPVRMRLGRPTAEGDAYLQWSIVAARRAQALRDTPEGRHALAQSLTVQVERLLERGRAAEAIGPLTEAAPLLDFPAPAADAAAPALTELAQRLRSALGPARPRQRPGR